jgi:hypothetical protein
VRWEQEGNRKLIAPSERRIQFMEHLVDGVLRGDLQSRNAAYAIARQWGWMSADDISERGRDPLPNGAGKIYLLPMNMVPADKLIDLADAQIKAKETPPPQQQPPAETPPDKKAIEDTQRAIEGIQQAIAKVAEDDQKLGTLNALLLEAQERLTRQQAEHDAGRRPSPSTGIGSPLKWRIVNARDGSNDDGCA